MKIKIFFISLFLIFSSLKLVCSNIQRPYQIINLEDLISKKQSNKISPQDFYLILYLLDITKKDALMNYESSIHTKRVHDLNKKLLQESDFQERIKIHTAIEQEDKRHQKTFQLIVKKIIGKPSFITEGTRVVSRPGKLVRPFSSDEDDE